jgi:glycosyltransferase involved in cell wall biosynthesis
MRIAMMIESDGPGGAETMMFRLAEEMRRRGHTVVLVGKRNGTGWLEQMCREAGFAHEVYWLQRPIDPGCVSRLVALMRKHSIDIVHSHDFTMAVYGCAAARRAGLPHVITMHGGVGVCAALRRRVALRWAMRNSSQTVMVSEATARQFSSELGRPVDRFVVIPNGVMVRPGSSSAVRREFGIAPGEIVILAVGNLERHKGHRILLEALDRLRSEGIDIPWRLLIAGGRGGPEHDDLNKFIRDRGIEPLVTIALGRSDIPDLQALAEIYAMPSLVEGLPMALLEAMVAGKAIVASRTAGIPEAIVDDRDGLLVPPGDVNALAAALRSLLTDPIRRSRLAAAAGVRGRREFTLDVMADRYEALYRSALGLSPRAASSAA